jgi:hypothetical protein
VTIVWDLLQLVYMVNATLLLTHEIDSAYWREWELFRLPGGIGGFLILHLPIIFVAFWGLRLLFEHSAGGVIIALLLGLSGIFAFGIHMYFISKGRPEFKAGVSVAILTCTLLVFLFQTGLSIYCLIFI